MGSPTVSWRPITALVAVLTLGACTNSFDFDLRGLGDGFETSSAAQTAVADRPAPDDRGVISYPTYQVAIARRGDTVEIVADRVGLPAADVARFNGLPPNVTLRDGEVIALPTRVPEPSPSTGAIGVGPIRAPGELDVTTIAGAAIDRAGTNQPTATTVGQTGIEPIRHKVERGETAFTIARLYNVSVRSLAEWNGLGADLDVREGQFLLIPVVLQDASAPSESSPGQGTVTPLPPSAAAPLPEPTVAAEPEAPASPNLGSEASSSSELLMPVSGSIIRPYKKGENEGIDIGASAGAPVRAAGDGTVAAITKDTDGVPILVLRHAGNLLTVYAGVDSVAVEKGDTVKRGAEIAKVRAGNPSFVHFEVREGFDSVDPIPYLN